MLADQVMCAMMNSMQWKLRHLTCGAEELKTYLSHCRNMEREEFYSVDSPLEMQEEKDGVIRWASPYGSGHSENDTACAEIFWANPANRGGNAPTVFILHALMSAHAGGYRRLARSFNEWGWNVVFPHLPYHYSRVPTGYRNGALAITSNLIRNAEGLRQAVKEIRQLRSWMVAQGGLEKFGLLGTSYGGWVGALSSFLEEKWHFLALIQPIANTDHAIWENPGAASIRKILRRDSISRELTRHHAHLTSPQHGVPRVESSHIVLCSGSYDRVAPPLELEQLRTHWQTPPVLQVPQGHFGYCALPATVNQIKKFL